LRVKRYEVKRDDELIAAMRDRVELVRPYAQDCVEVLMGMNVTE
jgi:hypothetical protein